MLDQISIAVIRLFAKDNAFSNIFSLSSLLVDFDVFYGAFLQFCHYEMTNQELLLFFWFPDKLSLRLLLTP